MRFIVSLLFVALVLSSRAWATGPIQLCYDDADNFPWLIKDGQGLNNTIVDMAARRSGVNIKQVPFPWKRCLYNVETGAVAGGFAASYSVERAAFAVYPLGVDCKPDPARRLKSDGYSLYRLKGGAAHWNGAEFVNLSGRVGSQRGYASAAELRAHGATVVEFSDKPEVAMKRLLQGDIELLALMTYEGDEQLRDPAVAARVEKIASPFVQKPYFVIFNKAFYAANPKLVEDFWTALAAARESGEFKMQLTQQIKLISTITPVR